MEIKWEKLPERLYSEALKCLMCQCMRAHIREGPVVALSHCSAYMSSALTTDDDEAFAKDGETLMKRLNTWLDKEADDPGKAELDSFLKTYVGYIGDRVREVLDRATECPEFKRRG